MGRETWRHRDKERQRAERQRKPAGWTAVGCLLAVVLGLWAYLGSGWLLEANAANHWLAIPRQLMRPSFAPWLPEGILVQIAVGLIFLMGSFALLNIFYSLIFPTKPGETDAPPLRKRRGRR